LPYWAEGRRQRVQAQAGPEDRAVAPVAVAGGTAAARGAVPPVGASAPRAPVAEEPVRAMAPRARVAGVPVRVQGMGPRARVVGVLVRVRGMALRARVVGVRGQRVLVTAPPRATARVLVRRVRVLRVRRVVVLGGVVRRGVGAATQVTRGAVAGGIRGAVMVGLRWRRVPQMVLMVRARRGSRRRVRRLVSRGRRVVVVGSLSRVTTARPVVCSGRAVGPARATAQGAAVLQTVEQRATVLPVAEGWVRCSARQVTGVVRLRRRGIGGRRRVRTCRLRV
jgi:hypothetical protein